MTHFYGSRFRRADSLITAVKSGSVVTAGQWLSWIENAAALPPWAREHVFREIEPVIGGNGLSYIRSFLPERTGEASV
jgi:hypothetical protein